MSFLTKLFIDVSALPYDGYGMAQLVMLGLGYGYVLMRASHMIKDGSELLLLIPSMAGVVGSVVLPVLGAVPDGAIVIFSGLGPNAQEEVAVGIGALAGSTVMLLTVPWVLSIIGGRVNQLPNGEPNYVRRNRSQANWSKLDPPTRFRDTCVRANPVIGYNAKIMLVTLVPFLVIQATALANHCGTVKGLKQCTSSPLAALLGGIAAIGLFCFYLWDQARIANSDEVKEDKIDDLRRKAIRSGMVTLRGLFGDHTLTDREGDIQISADSHRFQQFLYPFFRKYDLDNNGEITTEELRLLLVSLGSQPSAAQLEHLMQSIDTDNSGGISFPEFCVTISHALQEENSTAQSILTPTPNGLFAEGRVEKGLQGNDAEAEGLLSTSSAKDDDMEGEEEDSEEPEIPEDLIHLSPEQQQRRILMRSVALMGAGVALVLLFSDPMVDVLSSLGDRIHIKPFYIAFVLAPLASNASELIAAYAYSQKKTERSITISFSSLIGAACMNNTFCLSLFLFLVYFKKLKWEFTAETLSILAVELVMFFIAMRRTQPMWYVWIVGALFPLSIIFVISLEAAGLD